jgi:hypothetical protein
VVHGVRKGREMYVPKIGGKRLLGIPGQRREIIICIKYTFKGVD